MNKMLTRLLAGLLIAVGPITVQAVPIKTLFDGASLVVGDKVFSNWELTKNVFQNGFRDTLLGSADTNNIEVVGIEDDPLNLGLSYFGNGEWFIEWEGDPSTSRVYQQFDFSYTVSTIDSKSKIKDNSLELPESGFVINDGAGLVEISERIETLDGSLIGTKEVEAYGLPGEFDFTRILFDRIDFDPQAAILVTTQIDLEYDAGGSVQLDTFEQRFSQVHEPTTLALMSLGLAGIGYGRYRSKKAA